LNIETEDGDLEVSAVQVADIIKTGKADFEQGRLNVGISDDVDQLVFMSRNLEPAIRLTQNKDRINAVVIVEQLGHQTVLPSHHNDHFLIKNQWFPLDHFVWDLIKNWFEEKAPTGWIPIAEYARVYQGLGTDIPLIDEIDGDELVSSLESVEGPEHLNATLYPYQNTGYYWLGSSCDAGIGGILGDEMGLGKTLQVIAVLSDRASRGLGPSLILAPVTIIENWRRELSRFAPHLRVYVHRGPDRARYPGAISDVDVVLTSYETAVNDLGLLLMISWDLSILDEAQNVKNPDSTRSKELKKIPRSATVMVTGTPLENRTLDVWSLCDYVIPGYFGTQSSFESTVSEDPDHVRRALSPLLLRREVADVASDLPEKIDIETALEMGAFEANLYGQLLEEMSTQQGNPGALARLMRLRQFTGHPGLLDPPLMFDALQYSAKLTRTVEILEEIFEAGQKALIFSEFTKLSDLISFTSVQKLNTPSMVMDGRTKPSDRQSMIDEFSQISGAALLVLHPKTGGAGLNITAASHVIHYTLNWNPAVEAQATARAYRRGQEDPVFVHRLYYLNSVDELVLGALNKKTDLFGQVVEPTDNIAINFLTQAIGQRSTINNGEEYA